MRPSPRGGGGGIGAGGRAVINAVALQDHFSRILSLKRGAPLRRERGRWREARADKPHSAAAAAAAPAGDWECASCSFVNAARSAQCDVCGALQRRSATLSGVSDPVLTMAQRMGLVAGPDRLTADEWGAVLSQCRVRGDLDQPCPICQQEYTATNEVLLSCSHLFHERCFQSYERYVDAVHRVCPICRKGQYQKRSINEGLPGYRRRSALRIQRIFRGHCARRRFQEKLEEYKSGLGDAGARRRYIGVRLGKMGSRVDRQLQAREAQIDSLFVELERNLRASRLLFSHTDGAAPGHALERWIPIKNTAMSRGASECAICFAALRPETTLLLSCTHLFHANCLQSLERFSEHSIRTCPLCREPYESVPLSSV